MPEGDTIFRTARTLQLAIGGQVVTRFESVLPKLERVEIDSGVTGRTVDRVEAQGKWLLIHFSGELILLTHMLMNGSWHIYRPREAWRRRREDMRVVVGTDNMLAVAFNVQVMEFHTPESLRRRKGFNKLGPSLLAEAFDQAGAAARLRSRPDLEVGVALLGQSFMAGIGNVFKSEVCFACRVNPFRFVACLTDAEAANLVVTARRLLLANVRADSGRIVTHFGFRRTTGRADPAQKLWVYQRNGQPCRRCGTPIESRKQGRDARTSFWCPRCQPIETAAAAG